MNHCWDVCLIEQIQVRIWHDSEFRHELLESSERWSAPREEDVGSLQVSLEKLQGDDASAALADLDVENEMHDVEDGLLFRTHRKLGREGAIYACDDEHGTEHHQVVKLCFIAYLDARRDRDGEPAGRGSRIALDGVRVRGPPQLAAHHALPHGEPLPGHSVSHLDAHAFRHACGDRRERRRR